MAIFPEDQLRKELRQICLQQSTPAHDVIRSNPAPRAMAKSLSSLWFKNIKRLGRVQQAQGRKLFKSLLPKAARPLLAQQNKSVAGRKPARRTAVKRSSRASSTTSSVLAALPGVWKMSYLMAPITGNLTPGTRRMFWLYLPASMAGDAVGGRAASRAPIPLVVMLHGCQQTACDFAIATRMNKLAERKGFAVLYPQQSAAADTHRCWHWYKRSSQQGLGDVGLVVQMIAQVQLKHQLDASRTYLAGLSAGAALATLIAMRYPQMIAAVGLHSAPVFGSSDSPLSAYRTMQQGAPHAHTPSMSAFAAVQPPPSHVAGMPAILIHGGRDAVVRPINMDQLTQQFMTLNAASIAGAEPIRGSFAARCVGRSPCHEYKTVTYYDGKKPQVLKCEIAALGHAWSGGDPSVAFSTPEGPDASLMMWNFFARHRRNVLPL